VNEDGKHATEGTPLFNNIRSQGYYVLAEAMHTGQVKLLVTLPHADKLRRELGAHHYEPREWQIIVEKKDKIKLLLTSYASRDLATAALLPLVPGHAVVVGSRRKAKRP
jgi:hypothetical protein